jgi:hypothetical protein
MRKFFGRPGGYRPLGHQAIRDYLGARAVRGYTPAIVNDPEAAAIALLVRLPPDDLDALSKKDIRTVLALGIHASERVLAEARYRRGKPRKADPGAKSKSRQNAALSRLKSLQCRD